ncbi:MAG: transposase [Myxococcaceae bacterium]
MTHAELTEADWTEIVGRLGGARMLEQEARATGALQRARAVKCGVDLLRLILAYCLGAVGLRATAAWAETVGLASLSNVALLGRLRNAVPWLESILARLLAQVAAGTRGAVAGGRLIRLVDATTVRKAGKSARESGRLWRVHAVFDLPTERFSAFELTDEKEAERIDRMAVVAGEIRIGDAVHCRADELADVMAQGGDPLVRAGWTSARWLDEHGRACDIIRELTKSTTGVIDRPVWLGRKQAGAAPVPMRLVAIKMPKDKAVKAVAEARAEAKSKQRNIMPGTLIAAEWVILITSLDRTEYPTETVLELYRLRWRIEIAFKRMKSLAGLAGPPGECPEVAKAWVLCHLIAVLLTEVELAALGDSPRRAVAHVPTYGALSAC